MDRWRVVEDKFDFDNCSFSRTIDAENLQERFDLPLGPQVHRILCCGACDVGPIGFEVISSDGRSHYIIDTEGLCANE